MNDTIHPYVVLGFAVALTKNIDLFHAVEKALENDPENIIFASNCDEQLSFFGKEE